LLYSSGLLRSGLINLKIYDFKTLEGNKLEQGVKSEFTKYSNVK
jgi:hypothetical protein